MYAHCLFCNADLGRNEAVATFPVGRALAFDAAKGRLWIVCARCARWNLTPLEERWEAVEACERLFRAAPLRAATDHIGLARAPDRTRLVRIGAADRRELAAWRYERSFAHRRWVGRLGDLMMASGVLAGSVLSVVAFPSLHGDFRLGGMVGMGAVVAAQTLRRRLGGSGRTPIATVAEATADGNHVLRAERVDSARLYSCQGAPNGWAIDLVHRTTLGHRTRRHHLTLDGDPAVRALRAYVPILNGTGATQRAIDDAMRRLAHFRDASRLTAAVAADIDKKVTNSRQLSQLPAGDLLAVEMAVTDESEQRATEGELAELEQAWRDAEEIAEIADGLAVPTSVDAAWQRLRARNRS